MSESIQAFFANAGDIWLLAAVVLMLVEAFGLPGVGLVFAGLGSLVVGFFIFSGMIAADNEAAQWTLFFISSLLWALVLWKPMQKFRVGKRHGEYNNIVGGTAYVGGNGLTRKHGGEVTWSGTIMRAELSKAAGVEAVEPGSQVVITEVTGATLVVMPKD